MLPSLLPDWLQRESLVNLYSVVSVPAPLIVSQCLTFTIVSVMLPICLHSLMDDTASCYKNDGREVLASIVAFFFAIWNPFIFEFEKFGTGQPAMSMVGALLPHSIPQTTTTRPDLSAVANSRSHHLQI